MFSLCAYIDLSCSTRNHGSPLSVIAEKLTFLPIPLAFGPSGTGKTTPLNVLLECWRLLKAKCIVASQRRKCSISLFNGASLATL